LLISLLDPNDHLALATTLAVTGWLYFPIRQFIWSRLSGNMAQTIDYRELIPDLLTTMLNTRQHELSVEWSQLLQQLFSPLNIDTLNDAPSRVLVHPEGVSLTIPGFNNVKGLELSYADRGNRLFNDNDRRLANAMHQHFSRIQAFREAFDSGVHEERRRVARDLHDDVGAKLLTLVYSPSSEEQAELARETLQELRAVIRDLEHKHYSLTTSLAELRIETSKRCKPYNILLQWNHSDEYGDYPLEARQHSNLQRIVRETVTNVLRHSNATTLQVDVQVEEAQLTIQISNDSAHLNNNSPYTSGRGMRNIGSRAEELGGNAKWRLGERSLQIGRAHV